MQVQAPAATIVALGRALGSHDARGVGACYAGDAVYRELSTGLTVQGRDAIEAVTREVLTAFPDATCGLGRVVPGSDTWTVEWWVEGTHLGAFRGLPATGERFRLQAASILRFGGALIAEETAYLNAAALWRQAAAGAGAGPGRLSVALVERYFAALRERNAAAAAACFHRGGRREAVGEEIACGRWAVEQYWQRFWSARPELDLCLEQVWGQGGQVAARYRFQDPAGGMSTAALSVFTVSTGGIARETVYANGGGRGAAPERRGSPAPRLIRKIRLARIPPADPAREASGSC